MSKILSRTKGNAYHKIDLSRFMLYPKYKDVKRTSFIDVKKLTIEKYQDEVEDIDITIILNKIQNKEF